MIANLMVEEAKDRRELRRRALDAEVEDAKAGRSERGRGQKFGLAIGMFAIAVGGIVAITGHGGAGGFIGGGGVVGLVTVFITGQAVQTTRAFSTIRPKRAKASERIGADGRESERSSDGDERPVEPGSDE